MAEKVDVQGSVQKNEDGRWILSLKIPNPEGPEFARRVPESILVGTGQNLMRPDVPYDVVLEF